MRKAAGVINTFLLSLLLLASASCHSTHHISGSKQPPKTQTTRISTEDYIAIYKDVAIETMHRYGIPASITLAQAIIESASGNSALARNANNHFGIKCTSSWKGETYYRDNGKENSCYRAYKNAEQSFRDHADFLTRDRYAVLFKYSSTDYKKWAHGLKRTGYASNPKYSQTLIETIERYNLHYYDEKVKKHRY